jgi:uncharacterized protein (TIGR00255 family)
MLQSMTGFARKQHQDAWGTITWEIRSVNHRYLDITPRLPELLRAQEMAVRDLIREKCHRGKIEAICKFNAGAAMPVSLTVNDNMLAQLQTITGQASQAFPQATLSLTEVLAWPGVVQTQEADTEAVTESILALLSETLADLQATRSREGEKITKFLRQRIQEIKSLTEKITTCMPEVVKTQRQRIEDKFNQLKLELDQDRLEQEIVWFMQKVDINEELSRLQAHITEANRILERGGVVGRRLDFLMQEFNREANTICSKSVDYQVSQSALSMKVLIEQMREQVQNIE